MSKESLQAIHQGVKEFGVWFVCGVSGFLAWSVWQSSLSMRELTVEVKHMVQRDSTHDDQIALLSTEVRAIREEQLSRTRDVYSMGAITKRLEVIEADLNSRSNRRWNLPDMSKWAEQFGEANPMLSVPYPTNGN